MSSEQNNTVTVLHMGPLPPPIGGMSVFWEQLVNSHIDGYEFHWIATNQVNKFKYTGWKRKAGNLYNALLLVSKCFKKMRQVRPHIVHVQTNSGLGFFEKATLLWLAKWFRARSVLHIHGGGFRNFFFQSGHLLRKGIRLCLNRADKIIVLSDNMKSDFKDMGLSDDKLAIVRNGVMIPEKESARKTEPQGENRCLTILFLNRIDIPKGIKELLEAAEMICCKDPNVNFRIVGPASDCHSQIMHTLKEKNLLPRIRIKEPVEGQQKTKEYMQADIYVLPSHLEALPIGLLEAMSYGLPCIVTTVGAIPEIVKDGINGLLVPPKDVQTLYEALQRLIGDSKLRGNLGSNARNTILKQYTWQHTLQVLKTVYDSVIEQKITGE